MRQRTQKSDSESEASFTTRFNKWAQRNLPAPCVFEVKVTKTDRIPFSAIRPHQKSWLLAACAGVRPVCWKIPDVGASYKPFDVFMVGNMDAYVVIRFLSGITVIGAERFFAEPGTSITLDRAKRIAAWSGDSLS